MKKTKMFLLLIAMLFAITLASCGGGGGGGGDGGGGGAAPAPTSVNLPKTGQTTSYATGDDGDLERGIAWPSQRFTVDGTGLCVTDNLTGLMWVRNANSGIATWQNALAYANGLSICGYADWRLPNKKELRSLIHYEQANSATWLNSQGFSNVQADGYWSSTTFTISASNAWYVVYANNGFVDSDVKTNTRYVWPVRAGGGAPADLPKTGQTTCYDAAGNVIACANTGQDGELQRGVAWPSPRFTVDGTGLCITDNLTGLMWVRNANSGIATWQNALAYANGLSICGYTDWRLPNVNELKSLVNVGEVNNVTWLTAQGFSNVLNNWYWSSTTSAYSTGGAWYVYMSYGGVTAINKTNTIYVWPVRAGQ